MRFIYPTLISIILFACDKIEILEVDSSVAVLEGYISPDDDLKVCISKQIVFSSNDTNLYYLNDLDVFVQEDDMKYILKNEGDGIYTSSEIALETNKIYTLSFVYDNRNVRAVTSIPNKPSGLSLSETTIEVFSFDDFEPGSGSMPEMPDPVTISWTNTNNDYHMIVVENIEESPELIDSDTDRPVRSFRNTPTQDNSQDINPMTFVYYGKHMIILYKLNAEYAALYEQLGTNSLDITEPPSNVENGLGIFTGINSDTAYINVVEQ